MPDEPSDNDTEAEEGQPEPWTLDDVPELHHELMLLLDKFASFTRALGGEDSIAATHILHALMKCLQASDMESLQVGHKWARDVLRSEDEGGPVVFSRWTFPVERRDGRRYDRSLAPAFDGVVPLIKNLLNMPPEWGRHIDDEAVWIASSLLHKLPGRFAWLSPGAGCMELAEVIRPTLKTVRGASPEEITEALFRLILNRCDLDEKAIDKALHFLIQRESRDKGKP